MPPSVEDLRSTNKAIKLAKVTADHEHVIRWMDVRQLAMVVFHDNAWANVEDEAHVELAGRPVPEPPSEKTARPKIRTQAGYLLFLTTKDQLEKGEVTTSSLLDWRSHTIARVLQSTFAGETMSACEAFSAAITSSL